MLHDQGTKKPLFGTVGQMCSKLNSFLGFRPVGAQRDSEHLFHRADSAFSLHSG
jgi:hypothetical protein